MLGSLVGGGQACQDMGPTEPSTLMYSDTILHENNITYIRCSPKCKLTQRICDALVFCKLKVTELLGMSSSHSKLHGIILNPLVFAY